MQARDQNEQTRDPDFILMANTVAIKHSKVTLKHGSAKLQVQYKLNLDSGWAGLYAPRPARLYLAGRELLTGWKSPSKIPRSGTAMVMCSYLLPVYNIASLWLVLNLYIVAMATMVRATN